MRPWYSVVNDVVGGWAVSDLNAPLSEHPQFKDRVHGKSRPKPYGYIIAECMTETDAIIIATSLNKILYDPDNKEWTKALLESKDD